MEAVPVFIQSHTESPILDLPDGNGKVATGLAQFLNVPSFPKRSWVRMR